MRGSMSEFVGFALHPVRALRYAVSRFLYPHILRMILGVTLADRVEVREFPIISVATGGRLILGRGVKLNSFNPGYHLNMHSPVKLIVGRAQGRLEIGDRTRVNGACIHALDYVRIGSNCLIAANTQII